MNIRQILIFFTIILSSLYLNASLATAGGPDNEWIYCSDEWGVCKFSGTARVRYGVEGAYNYGIYTKTVDCSNETFGDPAYGHFKNCYFEIVDNPPSVEPPAAQAPAGGSSLNAGNPSPQNSSLSYSANDNALSSTMCNAMRLVTGNAGKAFAAFAIISLGIGFFTGKVSWGLMIGVAIGIAAMFGAPTIVAVLSGKDTFDCGS
ncbi:MAG: hypothetical protein EXR06_01315 [Rickettsiales bacterium]|nr:hypothetical protein [Rickettsiales bacterium]